MPTEHTSSQFDAELESVRLLVFRMGGLVEEQFINAIDSLINNRLKLADEVITRDHQINAMEVEIDKACSQIIARRQPTAGDLRLVMTVIKTITDLERIGDESKKIARKTKQIFQTNRLSTPRFIEIKLMSDIVLDMLRSSLDAFARLDINVAAKIAQQDLQVDEAFRSSLRHLITFMMENPRTISSSIDVLFAAKAIERIGDHAKNMSEYVVYMVGGKNVRHTSCMNIVNKMALDLQ